MQSQITVVAPPAGSSLLPRWARGSLSVPCSRDTHSYCSKVGLAWSSIPTPYGAEQPGPKGSALTSPDQRPRTRSPFWERIR